MSQLTAEKLKVAYGSREIVKGLDLSIPKGQITAIVGPNGCGKSTLLKTMARILQPAGGQVILDGELIQKMPTAEVARKLAILPQTPEAPSGLTVEELVAYGRYPHQRGIRRMTQEDKNIVDWALNVTGMAEFRERPIEALSGGQRQRVWIALALAQDTELLLLDEPTTYLDLTHQLEVLLLLQKLNREQGRTIVMVLHDLNHAARFAHYMVALRDGRMVSEGRPEEVMTENTLKQVFQIDAHIHTDPRTGKPVCVTYDLLPGHPMAEAVPENGTLQKLLIV
ncbi:ABC transporter ATP-binding protein [Paenibacillus gansuensis]|uniref:ABC transporter ATP-binding protein n=1 Tax=Paenibacillus gansuensis TaxID=306542 RepID=A0ABW5PAZ5_9BACL